MVRLNHLIRFVKIADRKRFSSKPLSLSVALCALMFVHTAYAQSATKDVYTQQLTDCQKECTTAGAQCAQQGSDEMFCIKRAKECSAFCGACMPAFTNCMRVSEKSSKCQEPFAACLEDKLGGTE